MTREATVSSGPEHVVDESPPCTPRWALLRELELPFRVVLMLVLIPSQVKLVDLPLEPFPGMLLRELDLPLVMWTAPTLSLIPGIAFLLRSLLGSRLEVMLSSFLLVAPRWRLLRQLERPLGMRPAQ